MEPERPNGIDLSGVAGLVLEFLVGARDLNAGPYGPWIEPMPVNRPGSYGHAGQS